MSESSGTREWHTPSQRALMIPGFEIVEELGRGGMGVVYKARQTSSRRLVALKVLRDGALAGPQELARFRIEALSAARMRHDNIVQIHEVGQHEGRPYFAMELVEGGSLDQRLSGQPQPAVIAAELVRTLALAVQHAHAHQVVHRDLKPANVLIAESAGQSAIRDLQSVTPKIADFGLAKRLDSHSTALTKVGAVMGTPSYMAPEQAAGRVGEIGPAADIYALGAMLYEALTGRPPFVGETWSQMLQQVLNEDPTPPTQVHSGVPRELETVCLKCLEKEPDQRYATAEELADDLGRFLAGGTLVATTLDEKQRLLRRAARDGYQVLDEIGRGPGATVYRAHYGPLKQPVALKIFSRGSCTREVWEQRVRRGADLWSAIAHPQVVLVQRAGWWDGAPYVDAEYIPHGSLATRLADRPYKLSEALLLVQQLAEVVSYLHRQGLVHGNLKPSNVLLAADEIPRVIDLHPTSGLVRDPPTVSESLSSDAVAGLAYLAPELIDEPRSEPRPNTDIYGLGLILYELLARRPAFGMPTARETLEQVRFLGPRAPSQFNPDVPPRLDALCLRCLRKDPWRRYARVYDLSRHLRELA